MIELLCTDYNKKATFIHFYLSNAVLVAEHVGVKYAVALLSGTDSLHLAIKLVPMEALRFYEKLGFNESRRFK